VAWRPAIIIRGYIFTFTASDFCEETLARPTGEAAGPPHKFYAAGVFCSYFFFREPRGCYALLRHGSLNAGKAWIRGLFRAGDSGEAGTCRAWNCWLPSRGHELLAAQ